MGKGICDLELYFRTLGYAVQLVLSSPFSRPFLWKKVLGCTEGRKRKVERKNEEKERN